MSLHRKPCYRPALPARNLFSFLNQLLEIPSFDSCLPLTHTLFTIPPLTTPPPKQRQSIPFPLPLRQSGYRRDCLGLESAKRQIRLFQQQEKLTSPFRAKRSDKRRTERYVLVLEVENGIGVRGGRFAGVFSSVIVHMQAVRAVPVKAP